VSINPGSLSNLLQFKPALDDFNEDNTAEIRNHPTLGGHKRSFFCQIEYQLYDDVGLVSDTTKTITITVLQINDLPRENAELPSDNDDQIDINNFFVNEVYGFENTVLFFYLDAYDVEGDDFNVVIFDCDQYNGQFYGPSVTQMNYLDSNGNLLLNSSSNILTDAFDLTPIDCVLAQTQTVTLLTSFSQTNSLGWWLYFVPNTNDNGPNYNKISLLYDDGIQPRNTIYGTFRFITILPVNQAPVIWGISSNGTLSSEISYDNNSVLIIDPFTFTGDNQVNGTVNVECVVSSPYNFGLSFSDIDAYGSTNIYFEISITSRPISKSGEAVHGSFAGFTTNGLNMTTQTSDKLAWTSTIDQANLAIKTLTFLPDIQGSYTVVITVDDNGSTGRYCPPGKYFTLGQTSCPRTSQASIYITAQTNQNFLLGVGTGVGAGVLALAAIGALLGAKFFKPEETNGWNEWDVNNLGDVALSNPFYEQQTQVNKSQIYDRKDQING